jgi:hypothetical protein
MRRGVHPGGLGTENSAGEINAVTADVHQRATAGVDIVARIAGFAAARHAFGIHMQDAT